MRLSIFVGLLYVAYCINPLKFDELLNSTVDIILVNITFWFAFVADIKDLFYRQKSN